MKQHNILSEFFDFRPGELIFYVFLIALAVFILGVQIGIKHGRELELQDLREQAEAKGLVLPSRNAVYCERTRQRIENGIVISD